MTRFILVRHGETEWNREVRFRGRADIALNSTGVSQAIATADRIKAQWQPSAIYSSEMRRARQTAQPIAERFQLTVQPRAGLNDIDFGTLQGLTIDEALSRSPEVVRSWHDTPGRTRFPHGESLDDLRVRGMAALDELTELHGDATIVLVGHTVINRVLLLGVLGLDNDRFWRLGQDNCAINVFEATDGDFTLLSLNDTCHLSLA